MQKSKPLVSILSILSLLLLLFSLGARYWAGEQAARQAGPTHLAADSEQVFVVAGQNIFHLSDSGDLLARYPVEVAGLQDIPIDLRFAEDGTLLVASQQPAHIQTCDISNWNCTDLGTALPLRPQRQFKLLPTPGRKSLLLTDARGDQLLLWDLPDQESKSLLADKTLAGPNDLDFDRQGHLWVADTDHRRLVELVPSADMEWQTGRSHSAVNEYTLGKRYYPMMLALGNDGNWWVTQASEFSDGRADLVIYNPDEGAIGQVPLPEGVMATDVASLGEDILVTDLESYVVYRVNTDTHAVTIFGDQAFVQALEMLRDAKVRFDQIGYLALAGVIVFAILMLSAAIVATPREKRWTPNRTIIDLVTEARTTPRVDGIYWLKRNEKVDRQLKWLPRILWASTIFVLLSFASIYLWVKFEAWDDPALQSDADLLGMILLISALVLAGLIPLLSRSLSAFRNHLGTDGKQFYLGLYEGRQLVVAPSEISYTGRALLYRQHAFPLHTGKQQTLYQAGEVETWIAPLLQESRRLTEWQGLKHQWKHYDFLLIWTLIIGAAGGAALIFLKSGVPLH
jgi:hypothetical protein